RILRDREAIVDHLGALARPVPRVQDEAAPLLDRAAVVDTHGAAALRYLEAERADGPLDRDLADRKVDDQPERSLRPMPHDVDHGPGEPRVAHGIGRHEQASGQRAAAVRPGPAPRGRALE